MEAFMGTVLPVAFKYAPNGWAFCNGQLMPISQNSALFALLGTTYGGDGQTTFGLPDLRGRTIVGSQGTGPGLSPVTQGELSGTNNNTVIANGNASVSLTAANLPAHTHPASMTMSSLNANTVINVGTGTNGVVAAASGNGGLTSTAATSPSAAAVYLPAGTSPTNPTPLGGVTTSVSGSGTVTVEANTGGGQTLLAPVQTQAIVNNMQPYIGLNYIIALQGIYPSQG